LQLTTLNQLSLVPQTAEPPMRPLLVRGAMLARIGIESEVEA
jgi:hypothetical protein